MVGLCLLFVTPGWADKAARIVGGKDATTNWPWMAAIVEKVSPDLYYGQFCSGVLIAPQWIVTTAHCLADRYAAEDIQVVLGIVNLDSDTAIRRNVQEVILHPDFNPQSFEADLALLKLEEPANGPSITLVTDPDSVYEGHLATILGWGSISALADIYPWNLKGAQVPIISNPLCAEALEDEITDRMICAGYDIGGVDACSGDSGGPLLVEEEGAMKLIGLTSFGQACALPGLYGVYTRISRFKSFMALYTAADSAQATPVSGRIFTAIDQITYHIPNVAIVFDGQTRIDLTSDAYGEFFARLPPGPYTLSLQAPDFLPHMETIELPQGAPFHRNIALQFQEGPLVAENIATIDWSWEIHIPALSLYGAEAGEALYSLSLSYCVNSENRYLFEVTEITRGLAGSEKAAVLTFTSGNYQLHVPMFNPGSYKKQFAPLVEVEMGYLPNAADRLLFEVLSVTNSR